MLPAYAELHCLSSFSFLRGASQPDELVERAQALRYTALALTDECSVAGVVRAHLAAKPAGLPLVIGSEFTLTDGLKLVLYATDRQTYGDLARRYKTPLVPFLLAGFADRPEAFQPDGLHPTAAFQPNIVDNIWPALQALLKKP